MFQQKAELMTQRLEIRNLGLKCNCGESLPLPLNPFPFPGIYFCPKCEGQSFTLTLEEVEFVQKDVELGEDDA